MKSDEKKIEECLLQAIQGDPQKVEVKCINLATIRNFRQLIGHHGYHAICDNNDWNQYKGFMVEIIGGMIPDLVFRSTTTNENRIIIEVKDQERLADGRYERRLSGN